MHAIKYPPKTAPHKTLKFAHCKNPKSYSRDSHSLRLRFQECLGSTRWEEEEEHELRRYSSQNSLIAVCFGSWVGVSICIEPGEFQGLRGWWGCCTQSWKRVVAADYHPCLLRQQQQQAIDEVPYRVAAVVLGMVVVLVVIVFPCGPVSGGLTDQDPFMVHVFVLQEPPQAQKGRKWVVCLLKFGPQCWLGSNLGAQVRLVLLQQHLNA